MVKGMDDHSVQGYSISEAPELGIGAHPGDTLEREHSWSLPMVMLVRWYTVAHSRSICYTRRTIHIHP